VGQAKRSFKLHEQVHAVAVRQAEVAHDRLDGRGLGGGERAGVAAAGGGEDIVTRTA
jgi:hypothetical protein